MGTINISSSKFDASFLLKTTSSSNRKHPSSVLAYLAKALGYLVRVASPGFGARGLETKSNFYWIGNHTESNVRICAALK